ncbi:MAG: DUF4258 domain-containing protein [Chloroflexi bacterium]|nr:DUF4258 domain-containing protein [Chloroflexota bacterium]
MEDAKNVVAQVRESAERRVLFLPHALRQMLRAEPMITGAEVRQVIAKGSVIEEYPEDPRGHSCLLLGLGEGKRPIHVVCAPKPDYLAIITAYLPDPTDWSDDFRRRVKR